jgi:hypothetical protein
MLAAVNGSASRETTTSLCRVSCNESQRLFITVVIRPVHDTAHRLNWSHWRRRHQARSQATFCV